MTIGAYVGTLGLTAVLLFFFNPSGADCSFNITAIVCTVLLALVMSGLSMSVYVCLASLLQHLLLCNTCSALHGPRKPSQIHAKRCSIMLASLLNCKPRLWAANEPASHAPDADLPCACTRLSFALPSA